MADAISIQELIDARTDAKTLEEAVNGDAVTTVLSRLGETYPTLSNALNQIDSKLDSADTQIKQGITNLFESGGLPATPFATKALMTASALIDGKYAQVTDDTVNNGLYVKKAGAWVKSNYDPVAQAKMHTDSKLNQLGGTFDTLTLLTTSPLVDNAYALVANDTDTTKNGHYKKVSGVWTKVAYDPVSIAKKKIDNIAEVVSSKAFFSWQSANEVILMEVDADKNLKLNGMEGSVQSTFTSMATAIKDGSLGAEKLAAKPYFIFTDANYNELVSINEDGGLKPVNMSTTVQEAIADIKTELASKANAASNTKDLTHHPLTYTVPAVCKTKIQNAALFSNVSPVPLHILPSDLTIGTAWTQTVKLKDNSASMVADRRPIAGYDPTYREDIGVVHPSITEFTERVAGYRYWLCVNPYTAGNDDIELPYIYGTNDPDLKDWVLIPDFPIPFDEDPQNVDGSYRDYLSDSGFTYDVDTGDLVLFWRKTLFYKNPDDSEYLMVGLHGRRFDGKSWSEIFDIVPLERAEGLSSGAKGSIYRSSSIIYNPIDNIYYIYVTHRSGLYYHTTPKLGASLSTAVYCNMLGSSRFLWHTEVKAVGDKLIIIGSAQRDGSVDNGGLFIGYSDNYKDFNITADRIHADDTLVYKPSFLPFIDENKQGYLKVVWSLPNAVTGIPAKSLMITKTTNINFGV